MLSEIEEDIFLKKLLKKYHTENSKKEIKRKKINPSKKKQRFFFEALAYEENYGGNALKKEEVNDENKEKIFTLKNGIKIIYKYEKNTVDLNDIKAKLSKIEKYDNDIMAEYFYHYGLLKKIIYYNKDRSINNINYFDIYYSIQTLHGISFINSDFLLEKNKYFKVKTLKEKDIKIYEKTDCKFNFLGNYPSNTLNKNSEALSLKILKDNIEIDQRDIKSFIGKLKSFPTITEYYSNNKIIKKDIYKVERIVFSSELFNKNIILIGKLEKTEYFNENNEVEKVKKINEYIHLRNAFWAAYIPRIEYYFQEKVPELFVEENFIEQEEKFLKGLLEKFRTKNPKEKINLKEEIKELEEEYDEINLVKKEVNKRKEERIFTFKNGVKIIHKYENITIDDSEDLEDDWDLDFDWGYLEDKLLKIEKYNKNGKIEIECFYHYGFLKKIIYYNEDQTINNINYFDIYYNKEDTSLSYIYSSFHFYKLDKYFETKSLKESDIKICVDTEYGSKFLENYPSDMIKAEEESLILKTLKENIKIEREDTNSYINDFESFPTMTEYYRNGKIIKKDIYKVERIMEISDSGFFHTNVRLRGVLEKTEYYNKENKIEKIEEMNRYIYVVNAYFGGYLPRIKFQ
ncbi:hypothetical protein FSDG_00856 [Fusobacterium animalis 7_1]|uniref:Uncharacterized protein n=1 Tax=Fusobacterium animalis 7_1 TaxID=457405 RepID=A0A140PRB9_9FUSO|nr:MULTISPECIES: hypothetical protein [Fusobacterium]EEO42297.2 hypothetical protein FSDG_00856 [Fusobacterium animalis 7_1]EPC07938.1 hypothetical protein HMPREF9369_02746 [Fusobacterium polymorphum F0401]